MNEEECVIVSNKDNYTNGNFSRDRGENLFWTTIVFKYENNLRCIKVHNDISVKYTVEKKPLSYGKRLPRGSLKKS